MFEGNINISESPHRVIVRDDLEDFLADPVRPEEVRTKMDFISRVQPWLSDALMQAGYPLTEIDTRLSKAFNKSDFFNRDAEAIASDINRVINNWVVESGSFTVEKSEAPLSPFAKKTKPVRSPDDVPPPVVTIDIQSPDVSSVSSIENTREAENLSVATEFDEREAEYAEYGNRAVTPTRTEPQFTETPAQNVSGLPEQGVEVKRVEPLVLENPLPETLVLTPTQRVVDPSVLTPEMRVAEANEPIVLEPVELGGEQAAEGFDIASKYQSKLDALNAQPFNYGAYVEYVFDLHTGLRHQYDAVITDARASLKRFDGFYAPSATEKQALQFLSSLQGQYAKLQKADSEIGIIRAELTNSLNYTSDKTNEAEVKTSTQNYLDAVKKLFINIHKLETLIAVAKTEEKPGVAEVYRAQFEKMQTEGNKVLQTLSAHHPLYERLKIAIESDLQELITAAAPENGGDVAIREQSSRFMARREQIKNLLDFITQEQAYQDFFDRARVRVQKLEAQFEAIAQSDTTASVKKSVAENIVKIKQTLAETKPKVETVGVLDTLRTHKDLIQGLLLESGELLQSLPGSETVVSESTIAPVLSDEELIARLENSPLGLQIAQNIQKNNKNLFASMSAISTSQALERRRQLEASGLGAKVRRLAQLITPTKIGKVTAVELAQWATETANQSSEVGVLNGSAVQGRSVPSPAIDQTTISEYLRTVTTVNPFETIPTVVTELAQAPEVNDTAPVLKTPSMIEEVVPGVILPDMVNTQNSAAFDQPLEIFSDNADSVPIDAGITFASPKKSDGFENLRQPYKINFGDKFWDINEGQTLAGKLPVMSQINPFFKQALIDRMRDKINSDKTLRDTIGGFGVTADQLKAGELMNLDTLNELGINVAVEYGYLK